MAFEHTAERAYLSCVLFQVINRRRLTSGPNFKPITYYVDPTGTAPPSAIPLPFHPSPLEMTWHALDFDLDVFCLIVPAVPERWRPAFKEGVEAWRPAFEAAGFGKEAIRAVLPGDADWPADYAPGDIR